MQSITLARRKRTKSTTYNRRFKNLNGLIDQLDQTFANYVDLSCDTEREHYNLGDYSISQEAIDTEIRFADLRTGTIFYREDRATLNAHGGGDAPIGSVLAMAEWNGTQGCRTINALDAVGIPLAIEEAHSGVEKIVTPDKTTYTDSLKSSSFDLNVAASDRSGLCGVLSFDCSKWGNYGVVDESKPYNCASGDMIEKYSVENLESYFNSWEAHGPRYRMLDDTDQALFDAYWNTVGTRTIDYVNPLVVTPAVFGSVASDVNGNFFYSVTGADGSKYHKIVMKDGTLVDPMPLVETKTFKPATFYPVAPV
jgi:hypothetical protein